MVAAAGAGIGGYLLATGDGDPPQAAPTTVASTTTGAPTTAAPTTSAPSAATTAPAITAPSSDRLAADVESIEWLWERLDFALRNEGTEIAAGVIWESNAVPVDDPEGCAPIADPSVGGLTGVALVPGSVVPSPDWEPPPELGAEVPGVAHRFYEVSVELSYGDGPVTGTAHMMVVDGWPSPAWFWRCDGYEPIDRPLIVDAWDAYNAAWEAGYEAAARYVADHAHPGVPAEYRDCLDLYTGWGITRRIEADPETIRRDDDWEPGFGIDLQGRNYVMDATVVTSGAATAQIGVRVAVVDGAVLHFESCLPDG